MRDVDVDIGMPADVILEDIHATDLPYPLPGETTKSSLFVLYAQLAQILSSCLDQLYTTTQRRGSIDKIARLQHELTSWRQCFNLEKHVIEVMGNGVRGPTREEDPLTPRVVRVKAGANSVLLLLLLGEVACLLIHRPALAFDTAESQFRISLRQCVTAAANLILIADRNRTESWLFHVWPSGCSGLLYSALVLLFSRWHNGPFPPLGFAADDSHAQSAESLNNVKYLVSVAVEILSNRQRVFSPPGSATPLAEVTSFLSHLANVTFSDKNTKLSLSESTLIGSSNSVMFEKGSEGTSVIEPMWHFENPADQHKYSMVGTCYLGYPEPSCNEGHRSSS
jgi:hypothetical protein